MNRTNLITGPVMATYNPGSSVNLFSKEDVTVNNVIETFKIGDTAHGEQDERFSNVTPEVNLTPEGRWSAALIAALWPYANAIPGQSVVGGLGAPNTTDIPLVMNSGDGEIHTMPSAFVYKMPTIVLSAIKTLIGQAGFRGVMASGSSWATANSRYQITATGGSIVDSTYDPATIKTQAYTGAWTGITGFSSPSFDTESGFTIDFNVSLTAIGTDSLGIIDYRFKSIEVMAKCVPIGPTSTQLLTNMGFQGTNAARGRSLRYQAGTASTLNGALTITGADGINYVVLPVAGLRQAGFRFGSTVLRNGEVGFYSARTFTAGVQQPLFTLAAS